MERMTRDTALDVVSLCLRKMLVFTFGELHVYRYKSSFALDARLFAWNYIASRLNVGKYGRRFTIFLFHLLQRKQMAASFGQLQAFDYTS